MLRHDFEGAKIREKQEVFTGHFIFLNPVLPAPALCSNKVRKLPNKPACAVIGQLLSSLYYLYLN
jgi:hypothetical protein